MCQPNRHWTDTNWGQISSPVRLCVQSYVHTSASTLPCRMLKLQYSVGFLPSPLMTPLECWMITEQKEWQCKIIVSKSSSVCLHLQLSSYAFAVSCAGFVNTYAGPIALGNIQWKVRVGIIFCPPGFLRTNPFPSWVSVLYRLCWLGSPWMCGYLVLCHRDQGPNAVSDPGVVPSIVLTPKFFKRGVGWNIWGRTYFFFNRSAFIYGLFWHRILTRSERPSRNKRLLSSRDLAQPTFKQYLAVFELLE